MLVKLLLYIKHNLKLIWYFIEWLNGVIFGWLYGKKVHKSAQQKLDEVYHPHYDYRMVHKKDLPYLENLLNSQDQDQYRFFKPHKPDNKTLQKLYKNPSFLMMGAFDKQSNQMVGYFFLRFFLNKRGFIGRMVDQHHQRQGIASRMSEVMYETLWQNGFRCLSTISKHNQSILKLHEQEGRLRVLKELPNEYLFVEISKPYDYQKN